MELPVALTIAGSDPSGGAGLQGDLKVFHQHRVYGCGVASLLTVQNTRSLERVECMSAELVGAQLDAVLCDLPVGAVKTGALGNAGIVARVAASLRETGQPLVIDPVRLATAGAELLAAEARAALIQQLLPIATVITPNRAEAEWLAGRPVRNESEAREAAKAIAGLGAQAVLVKGGHLPGAPVDTLYAAGCFERFTAPRLARELHGLGCALSAAITARLSYGAALPDACAQAHDWLARAIESAPALGGGRCPIDFFAGAPERSP